MPASNPVECPACGHEGISRTTTRRDVAGGAAERRLAVWSCRLCAYTWSVPATQSPPRSGGLDIAHP